MRTPLAVERRQLHNAQVPTSVFVVTRSSGEAVTFQVPETRSLTASATVEARDGEKTKFYGTAAVFDQRSEDLGGFTEFVGRGFFTKVLRSNPDTRALYNHNENYVLGRTTNGTLVMREGVKGLETEVDPPNTTYARDLEILLRDGYVDQMSFAFTVARDRWEEDESGLITRTLLEAGSLPDVSYVTYPAYLQTDAYARSTDLVSDESEEGELASSLALDDAGEDDAAKARKATALTELREWSTRCLAIDSE
jgi:HK97 family phage prohead protease